MLVEAEWGGLLQLQRRPSLQAGQKGIVADWLKKWGRDYASPAKADDLED
jgi:hypothetical protein